MIASGIYAIVNKATGGWYVGQSMDVQRRRQPRANHAEATRRRFEELRKDPVAYAAWCKKISDGKRRKAVT